jgi:hypothetical protein
MIVMALLFVAGTGLVAAGAAVHQAMEGSDVYVALRDAMGAAGHEAS